MTVFVVDGFKISPDCPVAVVAGGDQGDDNNNTLGHWRLETCLPEVRLTSARVESPVPPVPPPRPGNLGTKLLEYKQARGGLADSDSDTLLTNTDRDPPQKDGDSSRLQSRIPILKGSRSRLPLKTEKFPHKICLKKETSREEEEGEEGEDCQPELSLSKAPVSLGSSWSSQIPRPLPPSLAQHSRSSSSLASLPVRGSWLLQSRDSLEVGRVQILMSQSESV